MSKAKITFSRILGVAIIAAAFAVMLVHGIEDAHAKYIFGAGGAGVLLAAAKELAEGLVVFGSAAIALFTKYKKANKDGGT
jgi:hypothetical protein